MPDEPVLRRVEHELFIRSFFAINPPAGVAAQLAASMRDMYLESGETLYRAGEPADRLFFLVSGHVRLEHEADDPWNLEDHSAIGILDAALERPYSRTAVTVRGTHLIEIDFADYLDVLEDHFEFAKRVLSIGAERMDDAAKRLAPHGTFAASVAEPRPGLPPASPQRPFDRMERLMVLRATPFLERASVQVLASLSGLSHERRFRAGAQILHAGEPAADLVFLASGRAAVLREHPRIEAEFAAGHLLGGHASFGMSRHAYDAHALTDSIALVINKEDFFDVAEDHFVLGKAVFASIALERERLMQRIAALEADERRKSERPPPSRPGLALERAAAAHGAHSAE
ncbi:MAG TPA: cyclic nucleotide-binding domain-containing protein [Polyangiaceae bacterium]